MREEGAREEGPREEGAGEARPAQQLCHRKAQERERSKKGFTLPSRIPPRPTLPNHTNPAPLPSLPQIVSPKREAKLTLEQYKEIYDRLIDIFQTRPRDDWKKLIVFSKQWDEHATGVFDRWGGGT